MTKITEHFSLEEFHCKDGTPYPEKWIESRLRPLCELLEEIRVLIDGGPLHVISGYRSPAYNKRIFGAEKSQHIQGRAADIVSRNLKPVEVYRSIDYCLSKGHLKNLRGLGIYPSFIHVDIRPTKKFFTWEG